MNLITTALTARKPQGPAQAVSPAVIARSEPCSHAAAAKPKASVLVAVATLTDERQQSARTRLKKIGAAREQLHNRL